MAGKEDQFPQLSADFHWGAMAYIYHSLPLISAQITNNKNVNQKPETWLWSDLVFSVANYKLDSELHSLVTITQMTPL